MVVNLIAMPFMSIGLLPLAVIFYCLRNYYLKTSSEIKRLETSGNDDSILLQHSVRSSRLCPLVSTILIPQTFCCGLTTLIRI